MSRSGRQVVTSAPPQVEVVVGEQTSPRRTLVHLINYTGYQGRSFHDPLEIRDVRVELPGVSGIQTARSAQLGEALPTVVASDRVSFVLPRLGLFDLIVLE